MITIMKNLVQHRRQKRFLQFFLGLLFLFSPIFVWCQEIDPPSSTSPPEYAVTELKATTYADQTVLVISGKIRNMSMRDIRGMIVIYLKNESNDVIGTIETELKSNSILSRGELSNFEVTADISEIRGIKNVSVELRETT